MRTVKSIIGEAMHKRGVSVEKEEDKKLKDKNINSIKKGKKEFSYLIGSHSSKIDDKHLKYMEVLSKSGYNKEES